MAFYPDGAWWLPCLMEGGGELLDIADSLGIDDSFCPVRAMLGAFVSKERFPIPGLLTCSVGATCDDFSAIAQRVEALGFPEFFGGKSPIAARRNPASRPWNCPAAFTAPAEQVAFVKSELERVRQALEAYAGRAARPTSGFAAGIARANQVRMALGALRQLAFTAEPCPLPALEMLVAEMLAIHFCSDHDRNVRVLAELLAEVRRRVRAGQRRAARPTPSACFG